MISKDEIKCVARRFAWRSCVRYVENKRNWEASFNMGFKAANQSRAIKNRQELYGLLRERYASATTQSKPTKRRSGI
jgi:hypothetical protein